MRWVLCHAKKKNQKAVHKSRSCMVLYPRLACERGGDVKPKLKSKNQVKTKNYEFIDWLLAIDASVM